MKISPSIMCANLLDLARDLVDLEKGGADTIHVDIMDGHFVPGFTFGTDAIRQMRATTSLPLDVHLMSDMPDVHMSEFLKLGIEVLSVHAESSTDITRCLSMIKAAGVKAGIALNPGTPIENVAECLCMADTVLIMAVCPGFIGQRQIRSCVAKAGRIVRELNARGLEKVEVVVDGGVKVENIADIAAEGVHRVVSGTGIFRKDLGVGAAIAAMRRELEPVGGGQICHDTKGRKIQ